MSFHFSVKYFVLTCFLFIIEVLIAVYLKDGFVRPYLGDFLVVILLFCFVKTFINSNDLKTGIAVLLFAYFIELTQYFKLVNLLGWQDIKLARVVMGSSFSWEDILAYTLGVALVLIIIKSQKPKVEAKGKF